MKEQWVVYGKKADFAGIAARFGINQVTARIMRNRDVQGDEEIRRFLSGTLSDLGSPFLMKDLEEACDMLGKKIYEQKHIRVIGDYDIDGICSTYILVSGLKRLGAVVDYDIPDRIKDGYGLNIGLVELAADDGVDTIVTCDNGISAWNQIAYAKSLGMTVVVTDHHEVPFEEDENGEKQEILPPADYVINPHQKACPYPFKNLCGAVVAFKLVEALYETWDIPKSELSPFVEAAGLATVGDVMVLQGENRIMVREALKRMENSKIKGLKALMDVNGLNPKELGSYSLGFVIGPCLNAGGRLDTAKKSLALFLEEDPSKVVSMAQELKELNDTRKDMTAESVEAAEKYIEDNYMTEDDVYVIYLPDCHESLAGIVAGKIREKYNHPVFVITKGEEGLKGSGRSIPAYSMFEKMNECKEYLTKFGGHPLAAGLSLAEENLEPFREKLNRKSGLKESDFAKKIWIDVPMPFAYVTEALIQELHVLEPFGNGNEKPVFAQKNLFIVEKALIGKNRNVLKMKVKDERGYLYDTIMFHGAEETDEQFVKGDKIQAIYYPAINEYMGNRTIQMVLQSVCRG